MEYKEFSAKTVDEAIIDACAALVITRDKLEYEVVEEGSSGFLGLGSKNAVIKARAKSGLDDVARDFLKDVLSRSPVMILQF